MTAKELILDQLAACNDRNGWFVSAASALKGLSAEGAARGGGGSQHSVWQIVNHIIFWNERYLLRFRDRQVGKVESSEATFEGERTSGSDAEWQAVVSKLGLVMTEWIAAVRDADDARLAEPTHPGKPETWIQALANTAIHTAYHVGQIVTLRKEHGDWDPSQGVS